MRLAPLTALWVTDGWAGEAASTDASSASSGGSEFASSLDGEGAFPNVDSLIESDVLCSLGTIFRPHEELWAPRNEWAVQQ